MESPGKVASGSRDGSGTVSREASAAGREPTTADKGKRKADEMEDRADWPFTRCLPVLTDLLRDDEFVKEVRKVSEQRGAGGGRVPWRRSWPWYALLRQGSGLWTRRVGVMRTASAGAD